MNFEEYKKIFVEKAKENNYSETDISRCLSYSEKLFANQVPVIYNTTHFSGLVGYRKSYLKRVSRHSSSIPYFYRRFSIPKKNGAGRIIHEPLPSLKEIQFWILKNILENVQVSVYATAYLRGVSILQNVKIHSKKKLVISIDLENFFDSIRLESVEAIFKNLGYSNLLSNLFAKICCLYNRLPQGSPTSPYLSNIFLSDFDNKVGEYCKINNLAYTRYADDLTFSSNDARFEYEKLLLFIDSEVNKVSLKINPAKTKVQTNQTQQIVTGIVVNQKAQVPRKKRNDIRNEMFYVKKFGLQEHVQRRNQRDETQIDSYKYLKHLLGRVNYVLTINPKDEEFIGYKDHLYEIEKEYSVEG
ncbi:reverse transcriptase family protein [Bernardetia sp. Wsw4-3y2]|uniref:reverse transcriptase family protein n=1 Tax=Bernardetia sp. Wsw4-3y2 TaxID=3127471 RepID=UPI0030CD59A2